jgi:hypothetical protein
MFVLITTFYYEKDGHRRIELLEAIRGNIKNCLISKIYILCESGDELLFNLNPKIEIIKLNQRPKFQELIKFANGLTKNIIKIIANTDIYFDETLIKSQQIKENNVYCLTRWDLKGTGEIEFYPNFKSQDAWIFPGRLSATLGNYYMGLPGCDNRFAKELLDSGRKLKNPSLTIRAIHIHGSNLRNYNKSADRVIGEYAYPLPTELKNHKTQWGQIKENDLRLKFLHRKWRNNLDGTSYMILERLMAKINSFYLKYFLR